MNILSSKASGNTLEAWRILTGAPTTSVAIDAVLGHVATLVADVKAGGRHYLHSDEFGTTDRLPLAHAFRQAARDLDRDAPKQELMLDITQAAKLQAIGTFMQERGILRTRTNGDIFDCALKVAETFKAHSENAAAEFPAFTPTLHAFNPRHGGLSPRPVQSFKAS